MSVPVEVVNRAAKLIREGYAAPEAARILTRERGLDPYDETTGKAFCRSILSNLQKRSVEVRKRKKLQQREFHEQFEALCHQEEMWESLREKAMQANEHIAPIE